MRHPGALLSALLDGEVTPDERTAVESHLAGCAACREELEGLAAARSSLRSLPAAEPPSGVLAEPAPVVRRIAPKPITWAAAAAAAALITVGLAVGGEQGPVFDLDDFSQQHTARVVVDPGISTLRTPVGGP